MTKINNEILFRRLGKIYLPTTGGIAFQANYQILATALEELTYAGYKLSDELLHAAVGSEDQAAAFSKIVKIVIAAVKAHRDYKPMYPNFPSQVKNTSAAELYVNAILHYFGDWIGARIMPGYDKTPREQLKVNYDELKTITLASGQEFFDIFAQLLGSKTSWNETDQADVKWFLENAAPRLVWPGAIPNKENLGFLAAAGAPIGILLQRAKTATDVLRLGVALSGGDTALSGIGVDRVRFKSQPKVVRRAFLQRLNALNADSLVEDMRRNPALWKLFLHSLHAGEYAHRYQNVAHAAWIIRNNEHVTTFGTQIEDAIEEKHWDAALFLLSQRPGEFARRLDKVLRDTNAPSKVLAAFKKVASQVSTPVLWQLYGFYLNRDLQSGESPKLPRVVLPKGRASKVKQAMGPLPDIPPSLVGSVLQIILSAIEENYAASKLEGRTYIDPDLFSCTIPTGTRSASKSLYPVGRGTRVQLGDAGTVRLFIWWKDLERKGYDSRVDIDLSAVGIDEGFTQTQTIAYYHLRDDWAWHSGDITSAPNGAAEFIDIDRAQALRRGHRYIGMTINSYTGQPFDTLPEVFAGVMERSKPQSGEIFEPRTVQNAFDVTSPSRMALPLVVDVKTGEMIWTDMDISGKSFYPNNVANNMSPLLLTIQGLVVKTHPSLGEVFQLRAQEETPQVELADNVFEFKRGRVLLNGETLGQEKILAELL